MPAEKARRVAQIVSNPDNWPVVVHCWYGQDRTGFTSALARNLVDGLTPEQAWKEMLAFAVHGRHLDFLYSLPQYLKETAAAAQA